MSVTKVKLEVSVCKETYEVGHAFQSLVENFLAAKKAGGGLGVEIPAVLLGSMQDLLKAIDGVSQIAVEFKEDLPDALNGAVIPFLEGLGLLLQK